MKHYHFLAWSRPCTTYAQNWPTGVFEVYVGVNTISLCMKTTSIKFTCTAVRSSGTIFVKVARKTGNFKFGPESNFNVTDNNTCSVNWAYF